MHKLKRDMHGLRALYCLVEIIELLPYVFQVFVANVGDAKAVVARSPVVDGSKNKPDETSPLKAIVLTREHKAIYPQERTRIQKVSSIYTRKACRVYFVLNCSFFFSFFNASFQ